VSLASLAQQVKKMRSGHSGNNTVHGYGPPLPMYIGADDAVEVSYRYFAVPVMGCIPPQLPPSLVYSQDKYRKTRIVEVTGVKVELVAAQLYGLNVCAVLYETTPDKAVPVEAGPDGVPRSFCPGLKEKQTTRLMSLSETGFTMNRDGPFAVEPVLGELGMDGKPVVEEWRLASPNGRMFGCKQVSGDGGPLGIAEWRVGAATEGPKHTGCRVVNASLSPPTMAQPGVAEGKTVSIYWKLNKKIEFLLEGGQTPQFGKHLEVMFEVDSTGRALGISPGTFMPAGTIAGVSVTVYYKS
jgi:hypothetical protein